MSVATMEDYAAIEFGPVDISNIHDAVVDGADETVRLRSAVLICGKSKSEIV